MSKEYIIIVNEEDEVIGRKERGSLDPNDITRISVLWIANSNGDILLARRSLTKKRNPGKWGPAVAGTNEEGETYYSNIVKEAEEEIGLVDMPFKQGNKFRRHSGHKYFQQWFSVIVDRPAEEFSLQEDEVEQIKWFSPEKLREAHSAHPEEFVSGMESYIEMFIN